MKLKTFVFLVLGLVLVGVFFLAKQSNDAQAHKASCPAPVLDRSRPAESFASEGGRGAASIDSLNSPSSQQGKIASLVAPQVSPGKIGASSLTEGLRGDSVDGLIKRLPDEGATACYQVQTSNIPGITAKDGISVGLAFDGISQASRLNSYQPRQDRYPIAQEGIYYRVEDAGGNVLYWGQTGNPDNVSLETPGMKELSGPEAVEHEKARASLAASISVPLNIPQYSQPVAVKVWYTTMQTKFGGDMGTPTYKVLVPAR